MSYTGDWKFMDHLHSFPQQRTSEAEIDVPRLMVGVEYNVQNADMGNDHAKTICLKALVEILCAR